MFDGEKKVFGERKSSKLFKKIQNSAEVKISIVHAKHFHLNENESKSERQSKRRRGANVWIKSAVGKERKR